MELSDGMDFEAWNATVRALAGAVDRLEKTSRELAAPPWMDDLIDGLDELNLQLRRLNEARLWLPQPAAALPSEAARPGDVAAEDPTAPVEPDLESDDEPAVDVEDEEYGEEVDAEWPPPPAVPSSVPVRFGDPAAIARYGAGGRGRRRR